MSPKLTPEQKRKALFRRINGLKVRYTNQAGTMIPRRLTESDQRDIKEAEKSLAERNARLSKLSEAERSDLERDQFAMDELYQSRASH